MSNLDTFKKVVIFSTLIPQAIAEPNNDRFYEAIKACNQNNIKSEVLNTIQAETRYQKIKIFENLLPRIQYERQKRNNNFNSTEKSALSFRGIISDPIEYYYSYQGINEDYNKKKLLAEYYSERSSESNEQRLVEYLYLKDWHKKLKDLKNYLDKRLTQATKDMSYSELKQQLSFIELREEVNRTQERYEQIQESFKDCQETQNLTLLDLPEVSSDLFQKYKLNHDLAIQSYKQSCLHRIQKNQNKQIVDRLGFVPDLFYNYTKSSFGNSFSFQDNEWSIGLQINLPVAAWTTRLPNHDLCELDVLREQKRLEQLNEKMGISLGEAELYNNQYKKLQEYYPAIQRTMLNQTGHTKDIIEYYKDFKNIIHRLIDLKAIGLKLKNE
jgi:hypothetical protein